ncbi:hypothetical protein KGO95_02255 [Patescibacteria group bacterium]|nr:hypothetical protein [Patescibacteria group bacterium]
MTKHLGKIAVVGLLLGVGWFLLSQKSVWAYTAPFLSPSQQITLQQGVSQVNDSVRSTVGTQLSAITNAVTDQVNAFVQSTVSAAKTQAVTAVKTTVDAKLNALASDIGATSLSASGGSDQSGATPIVVAQQPGVQVYFTIDNTNGGPMTYTVDWKDGTTGTGEVAKGETKIVSHAWAQQGAYVLNFILTPDSGAARSYQVAISIL